MATTRLVEISDSMITSLASRPDAVQALPGLLNPILQAQTGRKPGCKRCQNVAVNPQLRTAYAQFHYAVVALQPAQLKQLKAFLDADKIRVVAGRNHQGIAVRHTL